jgi:hypothetical protein
LKETFFWNDVKTVEIGTLECEPAPDSAVNIHASVKWNAEGYLQKPKSNKVEANLKQVRKDKLETKCPSFFPVQKNH